MLWRGGKGKELNMVRKNSSFTLTSVRNGWAATLGCYCHIKNAICRFSSFINRCEIRTNDTLKQTLCVCCSRPEKNPWRLPFDAIGNFSWLVWVLTFLPPPAQPLKTSPVYRKQLFKRKYKMIPKTFYNLPQLWKMEATNLRFQRVKLGLKEPGVWHDGDGNAFQPAYYLPYCKGE